MVAVSHTDGLAAKALQAKTKCDRPAATKRCCLKLVVLNTQLDCVVDGLRVGTCNIEHLSSGVFPLQSSVRCMILNNSALAACCTKRGTMGLCQGATNDSNVNQALGERRCA